STNGGLYKTANFDSPSPTWFVAGSDSLPGLSFKSVAVDPTNAEIAYAATGNTSSFADIGTSDGALYMTQDGGGSWRPIKEVQGGIIQPFNGGEIKALAVVPETILGSTTGSLYATTPTQGLIRYG